MPQYTQNNVDRTHGAREKKESHVRNLRFLSRAMVSEQQERHKVEWNLHPLVPLFRLLLSRVALRFLLPLLPSLLT